MLREDSILRPVFSLLVLAVALGYYITGSVMWGYETRWTNPRYVKFRLVDGMTNFTEPELALYNGTDESKPIYLAIDGQVFDVTSKPETYGPIGAYRFFSGKDAARAFGTGCFSSDLTHDLRELDQNTLDAIRGWQSYFRNHINYWQVGFVHHPPLEGPPPPPCKRAAKPS